MMYVRNVRITENQVHQLQHLPLWVGVRVPFASHQFKTVFKTKQTLKNFLVLFGGVLVEKKNQRKIFQSNCKE